MSEKKYIKGGKIAEYYDVHINTVRGWTLKGCPHKMVGTHRRYNVEEVDEWLNSLVHGNTKK